MSKSQEYAKGTIAGRHYVFSVIDGETHRQKRQVVSQALNDVSIRRHQSAIVDQVDIFLDKILKSSQGRNGGTNMTEHCMLLSVDIIAILALGQTLNVQTDGIKRRALKPLFMPETIFNVILHWPRLSFLKGIAEILLSSRKKAFRKTIKNLIEERLIRGNDGYDLLSFIPKELAHGFDGFRGSDLWSELLFFLKAG
jgi:cytochrome P450